MGKTKHERKFDRKVEISAPYLDPEIIKQIHSPPKDQKLDIRHGGFKALLSDLNSQDSADELTPITENHLPSYIGISCAVSGYSNYSSYSRRQLEEKKPQDKSISTTSKQAANRSQTNSPSASRVEQHTIHHVTIDKSNINSPDQERKELTEKLTASAAERRRSPSPLPPVEDDRHHGAYVGARYFPMPEPSKLVHKHIPLLGIDDDVDPDTVVADDANKVEKKIASLYGDDFVEDWKESMSHKAKKELPEEPNKSDSAAVNLKEIVNLRPAPPRATPTQEPQVEVPTPNVKVLATVEKQFLNRLLTDENPPMPKSPSPQPLSPTSPKSIPTHERQQQSRPIRYEQNSRQASPPISPVNHQEQHSPVPDVVDESESSGNLYNEPSSPNPEQKEETSPIDLQAPAEATDISSHADQLPETELETAPLAVAKDHQPQQLDLININDESDEEQERRSECSDEVDLINSRLHEDPVMLEAQRSADEEVQLATNNEPNRSRSSSSASSQDQAKSPESQISSSTVERVPLDKQRHQRELDQSEEHIECEIRAQSPQVNNESSPVRVLDRSPDVSPLDSLDEVTVKGAQNLVNLSPEPDVDTVPETNNNLEAEPLHDDNCAKAPAEEENLLDLGDEDDSQQPTDVSESAAHHQVVDELQSEARDGHYFLELLKNEESFMLERVRLAEQLLAEHENGMDEERLGRIHSAIGKANLLINKKCNQFRELCEKSINGDANDQYKVLNDDLAGFWDMMSIQIADVRKSLENP